MVAQGPPPEAPFTLPTPEKSSPCADKRLVRADVEAVVDLGIGVGGPPLPAMYISARQARTPAHSTRGTTRQGKPLVMLHGSEARGGNMEESLVELSLLSCWEIHF